MIYTTDTNIDVSAIHRIYSVYCCSIDVVYVFMATVCISCCMCPTSLPLKKTSIWNSYVVYNKISVWKLEHAVEAKFVMFNSKITYQVLI